MKQKIIKFKSSLLEYTEYLKPAKLSVPQWYKDSEVWQNGKMQLFPNKTSGLKQCMPFLDSFTSGYHITLPVDLLVETIDGNPYISWSTDSYVPIRIRDGNQFPTLPIPHGCSSLHFTWSLYGGIELPKNCSAIYTHPFNRFDLPFTTLTGVIDEYAMGKGMVPFFIKQGFEGVIKQGTPIIQVIPFIRNNWKIKEKEETLKKSEISTKKSNAVIFGWYKKSTWKKKEYN